MNHSIKGSLSILSGAFLISFSPVFVNLVNIEPTVSGFYRMLFGSIALFIIYLIKNNENPLRKNISKFIVLGAIFFSLDLWFWHINYLCWAWFIYTSCQLSNINLTFSSFNILQSKNTKNPNIFNSSRVVRVIPYYRAELGYSR